MRAPEIHAVLVWSSATSWSEQILEDLGRTFQIREVYRVRWTPERFASNLSRLYGDTLPPRSEKERETGTGPFVLAVIEDTRPRRSLRRTARGIARVNLNVRQARERYRRLTGGGFRVHATLTDQEADKDLFLITGRTRADYADRPTWSGELVEREVDLVGTDGWRDEQELIRAIDVCGGCLVLGGIGRPHDPLVLAVGDHWWAERIAQGTVEPVPGAEVIIGSSPRRLELRDSL